MALIELELAVQYQITIVASISHFASSYSGLINFFLFASNL